MPALTAGELLQHLGEAVERLRRRGVDLSGVKIYLLGLLLLKRLSDRFEEEVAELIANGVEEKVAWTDPDEHEFMVPYEARWSVLERVRDVSDALDGACAALARRNPKLRFLLDMDFNDGRAFGDRQSRGGLLQELVFHFSRLSLRNSQLRDPEELGLASELFLESFARNEVKLGPAWYTPRQVAELIVQLIDPQPGMRVCDPACGTGGMLVRCAAYVARKQGLRLGTDVIDLTPDGQEVNQVVWALCSANMVLSGLLSARIEHGNTLRFPRLTKPGTGELIAYDRVLTSLPFNVSDWGSEEAKGDVHGRFRYGLPPAQRGDYAFVQHVLASLGPAGIAGMVVSHGVLFRGGVEGAIRQRMIDDDVVEAIIGLPANLLYGTSIPTAILLLNRAKPEPRQRRILFVDASSGFEARGHRNELRPADIERIVSAVRRYGDEDRFCRVASLDEVAANEHVLTIPRYVDTRERQPSVDIDGELAALRRIEAIRDAAAARMDELLRDLDHGT